MYLSYLWYLLGFLDLDEFILGKNYDRYKVYIIFNFCIGLNEEKMIKLIFDVFIMNNVEIKIMNLINRN